MSCREKNKKHWTKNKAKQKKKQEKINILTYHPHKIEKINCLGEMELARGKTLKSCEISVKAKFLAERVECACLDSWS